MRRRCARICTVLLLSSLLEVAQTAATGQAPRCTSWCHFDWKTNCGKRECDSCDQCVRDSVGREACKPTAPHDLVYEECAPACQRAICYMCMCKACSTCGGSPPVATSFPSCQTNVATSLDVDGRLAFTFADPHVGEIMHFQIPAGVGVTPEGSLGFGALQTVPLPLSGGHLVVQLAGMNPVEGSGTLQYRYSGAGKTYLPRPTGCSQGPPSHPPPSPSPVPPSPSTPPPAPQLSPPPPAPPSPPSPGADPEPEINPPPAPSPPPSRPAPRLPPGTKCVGPDDLIPAAPFAFPMSSASWVLNLPLDAQPCTVLAREAHWELHVTRDDGTQQQAPLSQEAIRVNGTRVTATVYGVRCPQQYYPGGCTFAIRYRWSLGGSTDSSTTPWSPASLARTSRPAPTIPNGVSRFEIRFESAGRAGEQWVGSAAQRFQIEAAKQMSVTQSSVHVVERYAEGMFLVFDLVPLELELPHMEERLLHAIRLPGHLGVSEMRRILGNGQAELLFRVSKKRPAQASAISFAALMGLMIEDPWLFPLLLCICCTIGGWKRRTSNSASIPGGKPRRLRQVEEDSDALSESPDEEDNAEVRVLFSEACGEEMEVILPLDEVSSELQLRQAIFERGRELIGETLPPALSLRLSFIDRRGSERPLTSHTLWHDICKASRIQVTCSTQEDEAGADTNEASQSHSTKHKKGNKTRGSRAEVMESGNQLTITDSSVPVIPPPSRTDYAVDMISLKHDEQIPGPYALTSTEATNQRVASASDNARNVQTVNEATVDDPNIMRGERLMSGAKMILFEDDDTPPPPVKQQRVQKSGILLPLD